VGDAMSAKMNSALSSYSDYGYNSEIEYADPHRLIQMLFEGALKRIAFTKGAMQRKEIEEKGKYIGQTIEIVGGLRASLDKEKGGEVAANLDALYEYIGRQLLLANLKDSEAILDEVAGLLTDVKSAWDAINTPAVEVAEVIEDGRSSQVAEETVVKPVKPANSRVNRAIKAYSV